MIRRTLSRVPFFAACLLAAGLAHAVGPLPGEDRLTIEPYMVPDEVPPGGGIVQFCIANVNFQAFSNQPLVPQDSFRFIAPGGGTFTAVTSGNCAADITVDSDDLLPSDFTCTILPAQVVLNYCGGNCSGGAAKTFSYDDDVCSAVNFTRAGPD